MACHPFVRDRCTPARSAAEWSVLDLANMSYQERIAIDPEIRSGKPCIKGTRITVYDVLEYLAGGMTEEQILRDFPSLARDDIKAALEFAADRERKLAAG